MGVTKQTLTPGNQADIPQKGDTVSIHYTGCLYDPNKPEEMYMGSQFDSSRQRGPPLKTRIGVGAVIRGWDDGVPQMSLGETAILTMSGDYGYGDRGFPGLIPPNSGLVFEVQLVGINEKTI